MGVEGGKEEEGMNTRKEKNKEKKKRERVKTSLTNMSEVEGETHSLKAFRRCISYGGGGKDITEKDGV